MNQDRYPAYVIIGATGGIGSEAARMLTKHGSRVLLCGRNEEKLEELSGETNAKHKVVDARSFQEVEDCFQQAVEKFGRLDGVVNCAGSVLLKPAHLTTAEEWNETVSTNLTTAFATVRAAGKVMANSGGSVVLISTAAAQIGIQNHEAIAAAKSGIEGLTLSAAATYAGKSIRFNAIAPGLIKTPLTEKITSSENAKKASLAMHALGRLGEPKDIASMIVWLLDPTNDWITGQVIGIDGGLGRVKK